MPNFSNLHRQQMQQQRQPQQPQQQQPQQQQQQQQQQIIYLQIPQPSENQLSDPQSLQQQISSQLQLLVPQIYNQLLNQMSDSNGLNIKKIQLNQNESRTGVADGSSQHKDHRGSLNSNFTIEENQSQNILNQVYHQNSFSGNQNAQKPSDSHHKKHTTSQSHTQINIQNIYLFLLRSFVLHIARKS